MNIKMQSTKNIIKRQINIKFTSIDQEINDYNVICYNTDIFEIVLEKLILNILNIKIKNFIVFMEEL